MPAPKTKTTQDDYKFRKRDILKHASPFSRAHILIVVLVFGAIGGYILVKSLAASNPNLPGDLNNDNTVNVTDLSILLSAYGTTDSGADINSDGAVNILDMSLLLSNYGKTYTPPVLSKPAIPSGLTATPGDGSVLLKWNPNPTSDAVDTYQVYLNGNYYNLNVTATNLTVTGLTNGTSYDFRISAHNSVGYGDWTPAVSAAPSGAGTAGVYEDTREGFPKTAAYRPSCSGGGSSFAKMDWVVSDGDGCGVSGLDSGHSLNSSMLGMIQPVDLNNWLTGNEVFSATYGYYSHVTNPLSDPAIGSIRAFQSSDWLHNTDGSVHYFPPTGGGVTVANWISNDSAIWFAKVMAYYAKQNGATNSSHPGIMGVWGDNDLWSTEGYAYTGTVLDPSMVGTATADSNKALWDNNYIAHHIELAKDLPGMVIGGNDLSHMAASISYYKGSVANGWLLPGVSGAGMKECAEQYFGLYNASGVDNLINGAQTFLAGKSLDGKQRFLMLNNCHADTDQINHYSLAVATIGGYYYWPYTQTGWWSSALTIGPSITDYTRNGARNWLGYPTAAPVKVASGLWKRSFQHGVVYANMTGVSQTVDGHTIGNQTGLFISQ